MTPKRLLEKLFEGGLKKLQNVYEEAGRLELDMLQAAVDKQIKAIELMQLELKQYGYIKDSL